MAVWRNSITPNKFIKQNAREQFRKVKGRLKANEPSQREALQNLDSTRWGMRPSVTEYAKSYIKERAAAASIKKAVIARRGGIFKIIRMLICENAQTGNGSFTNLKKIFVVSFLLGRKSPQRIHENFNIERLKFIWR